MYTEEAAAGGQPADGPDDPARPQDEREERHGLADDGALVLRVGEQAKVAVALLRGHCLPAPHHGLQPSEQRGGAAVEGRRELREFGDAAIGQCRRGSLERSPFPLVAAAAPSDLCLLQLLLRRVRLCLRLLRPPLRLLRPPLRLLRPLL